MSKEEILQGNNAMFSDAVIEYAANRYAESENNCYTNDYYGYIIGAKEIRAGLIEEIMRRQQLILSEPNGIVRETMINDLLTGLQ